MTIYTKTGVIGLLVEGDTIALPDGTLTPAEGWVPAAVSGATPDLLRFGAGDTNQPVIALGRMIDWSPPISAEQYQLAADYGIFLTARAASGWALWVAQLRGEIGPDPGPTTPAQLRAAAAKTWGWKRRVAVPFAVARALECLPVFEAAHPRDMRPRAAIEAAQEWVRNPCKSTMRAAYDATADDADVDADAAADAADAATAASYAASYAAADAAAYAADYAAYAAATSASAAAAADAAATADAATADDAYAAARQFLRATIG
jgi:hypothetical protein